jgi:hypothetical protein
VLTQTTSTLKEIESAIDMRLHTPVPTSKFGFVKRFVRTKGKNAVRVLEDQEKVKKLRELLDRAIEEFGVRTLMTLNHHYVLIAFAADLLYASGARHGGRALSLSALIETY